MTIDVTVETWRGAIEDVRAFLSEESAVAAEKKWLQEMDIKDDAGRQVTANGGTEFLSV